MYDEFALYIQIHMMWYHFRLFACNPHLLLQLQALMIACSLDSTWSACCSTKQTLAALSKTPTAAAALRLTAVQILHLALHRCRSA